MSCQRVVRLSCLALLGASVVATPLAAGAVPAIVADPPSLDVRGLQGAGHVELRNIASRPVTVHLSLVAIEPGDDGRDVVAASEDLLVFPIHFTLEAGASRTVRVGYVALEKSREVERLYRLIVTEQRPAKPDRLHCNIDVSVLPKVMKEEPVMAMPRQDGDVLLLHLRNEGTVTLGARTVLLRATPAAGEAVEARVPGWYVRPGTGHDFAVALPEGLGCITALNARIETLDGLVREQVFNFVPDACRQPPPEPPPEVVVEEPPPGPVLVLLGIPGWLLPLLPADTPPPVTPPEPPAPSR